MTHTGDRGDFSMAISHGPMLPKKGTTMPDLPPITDLNCKCGRPAITLLDKHTAVCADCAPLTDPASWPEWTSPETFGWDKEAAA